jgi:hypothetical protein
VNYLIDWLKSYAAVATCVGAVVAFIVGLRQFRRGQTWKRAEFLSNEMKELQADIRSANALKMIDWGLRRIKLEATEDVQNNARVVVTYAEQGRALLPHTFEQPPPTIEHNAGAAQSVVAEPEVGVDGPKLRRYTRKEMLIRDCYDSLFDRLDRFGGYLKMRLVSVKDLKTYVGYYIDDIAEDPHDATESLWMLCLLTYVSFYRFDGVVVLFKAFGKDISPRSHLFMKLVRQAALQNPGEGDLPQRLHKAALSATSDVERCWG